MSFATFSPSGATFRSAHRWPFRPAATQRPGAGLGAPIPGEDALLVAVHPEEARAGGEVGEVPYLLADHGVHPVEDPVGHVEDARLVLLGPRGVGDRVDTGDGVGAVFGDD